MRSVEERLSRRSWSSAVAFVLSSGMDAAVEERGRRDLVDMLLLFLLRLLLYAAPSSKLSEKLQTSFISLPSHAHGNPRHQGKLAGIEYRSPIGGSSMGCFDVDRSKVAWKIREGEQELSALEGVFAASTGVE